MPATMEKPLRDVLGEQASDSLVRFVDQKLEQRKHEMLEFVEEKFERRLTEEIGKVNERITIEISKVNERMTNETAKLDKRITEEIGKVNVNIAHVERNMIRWMFIFWIGQIGAIMGLLFAFFK